MAALPPSTDPNIVPLSTFERPSNPGKQAVAGITDIGTGLPILLGAVGAAGEAGYDTLMGDPAMSTKEFGKNFGRVLSEDGWQKDTFNYGQAGMNWVNEKLGITHPESTEDTAARLLGSLVMPVPAGFLGGLTATGLKGIAGKAATLLSPAIRMHRNTKTPFADKLVGKFAVGGRDMRPIKGLMNKTNAIRVGTQVGVGAGIHQGLSHLINEASDKEVMPLLFSDTALYGRGNKLDSPTEVLGSLGSTNLTGQTSSDTLDPNVVPMSVFEQPDKPTDVNVVPLSMFEESVSANTVPLTNLEETSNLSPELVEAEKEAKIAENKNTISTSAIALSVAGLAFGVNAWKQARQVAKELPGVRDLDAAPNTDVIGDAVAVVKAQPTPKGDTGIFTPAIKDMGRHIVEQANARVVTRNAHILNSLKASGTSDREARQLVGIMGAADDPSSMMNAWMKTAEMIGARTAKVPMRVLRRQYLRWSPERQQDFKDYVGFIRENIDRTRATAQNIIDDFDYDNATPRARAAVAQLKEAFDDGTFSELDAKLFKSEATAIYNQIRGKTTRVRPGLFKLDDSGKRIFIGDDQIKATIKAGDLDTEFVAMRKQLAEYAEIALEMAENRGVKSVEWGDMVRNRVRTGKTGENGDVVYHPGITAKEKASWHKRLGMKFGIGTSQGKTLNQVGNYFSKNLEEGAGVANPIDPFLATEHYVAEVLEHTNRSSAQWNMMERMTGIKINPITKVVTISKPNGKNSVFGETELPTYIGRSSPDDPYNQFGRTNFTYHDNLPDEIKGRFVANVKKLDPTSKISKKLYNPLPEELLKLEKALVIQRNGDFYVFDTSRMSPGFKNAMEFDARLTNGFLIGLNTVKRFTTSLITGKYSPFAPISATYNNQIGALNAMLIRAADPNTSTLESLSEAVEIYKAGLKGTYEIFTVRVSDDLAQILTENILARSKMYRKNPDLMIKMQKIFADKAKNTMLNSIQANTGRFASDVNAHEFQAALTSQLESTVPYIAANFGDNALPQFARIWKHFNESLHEGAAYGITLRELGSDSANASGNAIRMARQRAADLVGDTRQTGSSMDWFHASIPYSGPMIQAMVVMGKALKLAGYKNTAKVLTTIVGIPVALEVSYNNLLDPQKTFYRDGDPTGKAWTYSDYYWNGFTAAQRMNNRIVFAPGKPPWEAMLWPIVPELSMFRGLFIDAMEATMGLSGLDVLGTDVHGNNTYTPNHFMLGLQRVFNIPLPPPVKASLSMMGVDIQLGMDDWLSDEGDGIPFVQTHPSGRGEQVTGTDDQRRYIGDEFSIRAKNSITDITGMVGTAAINMYEAFHSGDTETSIVDRTGLAFDSLGESAQQAIRFINPLFSGSLRASPDTHTVKSIVSKTSAIDNLILKFGQIQTAGNKTGTIPARGNSSSPSRDPIIGLAASQAPMVKQLMAPYTEKVNRLRLQANSLQNSSIDKYNNNKRIESVQERNNLIDAINLQIDAVKYQQLAKLKESERSMELYIKNTIGVDQPFSWNGLNARN